ncbi:uncharacterized protein BXIN_2244 [Babesia sp. Xinjiang]|uniref:uncharacterized protein n=1 Tax=Babesia sp. Xinjiang TaxID=462227 RepID=UPI000A26579D|nr:uncharacterized protein BXIN_2244 [Babesia sp. Xinjiang]ORM40834.1 hypothetical protein BXIN_2244 [Babesia sp. Xinjiang]
MVLKYSFNTLFKRYKISVVRPTIARRTLYPRSLEKQVNVILLRDHPALGKKGAIVAIPRGYANYHLIPHGIAVYSNWENLDLFAGPYKEPGFSRATVDVVVKQAGNGIDNSSSEKATDVAVSIVVKTLSKERGVLCTPLSMYSVLDFVSRKHKIDFVPSQVHGVTRSDGGKQHGGATKLTLTGEYKIAIQVQLNSSSVQLFTILLTVIDHANS